MITKAHTPVAGACFVRRAPHGKLGAGNRFGASDPPGTTAPVDRAASLVAATGLTMATVNKSLVHLERLRVVAELTRKHRERVFSYARYIDLLNEGIELPDAGARR